MSEGFPLAILEAMAAAGLIADGVSGFLVPVSSPVELARAICSLLSDAGRAEAIGNAARQRAAMFGVFGFRG